MMCTVDGCVKSPHARGLCDRHYRRLLAHGDVHTVLPRGNPNLKHGRSNTPTYYAWVNMKTRCTNPNTPDWGNYGGRGITVCDRWLIFANFLADMGEKPDGLTLDRVDNGRGYEPGNCRWATYSEQNKNRRPFGSGVAKVRSMA